MIKIREYLSQFQCIGSDCPDPCCSGWNVPVDKEDRQRLLSVMSVSEEEELIDDSSISRMRTQNGRCIKQCDNGLCSLQAEFGHDILPNVCASYPRFRGVHSQGEELGAFLSCPEIVNLMLEHGDELRNCVVRPRAVLDIDCSQSDSHYEIDFLQVRTWFAERIDTAQSVDQLFSKIASVVSLSPAFFHRTSGRWQDISTRPTFLLPELSKDERMQKGKQAYESFRECIRTFAKHGWPYPKPMARLQKALEGNIREEFPCEEWMLAYLRHDWNVRWYVHSPNLLFHWQSSLFKVVLIRLLYAQGKPQQNQRERFVDAVYSTERLVEHTSLKRDVCFMYNQPWHFSQWCSAFLSAQTEHFLWEIIGKD